MKHIRNRVASTEAEIAALMARDRRIHRLLPAHIPDPYVMEYSEDYLKYIWFMVKLGSEDHLVALNLNASAFPVGDLGQVGRPYQFQYWS